jgi:hypothetical protein
MAQSGSAHTPRTFDRVDLGKSRRYHWSIAAIEPLDWEYSSRVCRCHRWRRDCIDRMTARYLRVRRESLPVPFASHTESSRDH